MSSRDRPSLKLPISERDHVQGPADAKVTFVEYGDYQCPFCGEAYPILKQVQKRFGAQMKFVFRNFPVTELHPRAEFGAELAEASGAQGKFWEMHDFIYEHQANLPSEDFFYEFAKTELGLDIGKLRRGVQTRMYAPRIREDFMGGIRSGVNGTPTFFINGLRHNDDYQYDTFVSAIESSLAVKKPKVTTKKKVTRPKKAIAVASRSGH